MDVSGDIIVSEHKHIDWWEIFLWIGFVGSIAYIPESRDIIFLRASVAAGLFAFAAIGVRATRRDHDRDRDRLQ